jgi:hypothetical protein
MPSFQQETGYRTMYLSALEYTEPFNNPAIGYALEALGYLVPTVTSTYRFHCSGDDYMRFFLSADESYSPESLKLICNRPPWTLFRRYATVSDPVSLVAGKKYFFQLLFTDCMCTKDVMKLIQFVDFQSHIVVDACIDS